MYFFWSKGTIKKKNHWGTEGSMNLWSSQWCFAIPRDLICTWSWFGCWGCFSSVNFPPFGAQGTQGLSDTASSPRQCLSLTRAPLLSVLMLSSHCAPPSSKPFPMMGILYWLLSWFTLRSHLNSHLIRKASPGDFPGGPVARTHAPNASCPGSIPDQRTKILHAATKTQ